jgi:primosomal protein N' (replication factor Y)
MYVQVAVNIPTDKVFSYSVPERLRHTVAVGKLVMVPFGRKRISGYIVECSDSSPHESVKDILDILGPEPFFNEDDLSLFRWISDYYLYPIGKTIHELTPGGISLSSEKWITSRIFTSSEPQPLPDTPMSGVHDADTEPEGSMVSRHPSTNQKLTPLEHEIMTIVDREPKGIAAARLKKMLGREKIDRSVKSLCRMGWIDIEERLRRPRVAAKKERIVTYDDNGRFSGKLTDKQSRLIDYVRQAGSVPMAVLRNEFKDVSSLVGALEKKGLLCVREKDVYRSAGYGVTAAEAATVIPNEEQEAALAEITAGIESGEYAPYLLHGVTGSGKTEVYLQAIAAARKLGGGAIYLVPEISLTPQLIQRVMGRFAADDIAVIHSDVPQSLRYDQWRKIQTGEINIVIGARSALFAPVRNLKLIIVDEEHDKSYKQEERLCYHARDLALVKARLHAAVAVLGSATPAVQTFFNAAKGKYRYLALSRRVEDKPLPVVKIVDMKGEQDESGESPILSRYLKEAVGRALTAGKQVLLFLNRRGFNTYLFCRDCGHVFLCPNCDVTLTYHAGDAVLKCHYCDYTEARPILCPACACPRIGRYGIGTERLEEEVGKYFPTARIGRVDSDTMARRGSYEEIMNAVRNGNIDILVGTQMIAKGHDYPGITLVGVVGADMGLNMPDFRAAERTFQILTQVSGRSGRGDSPGQVVIQTFNPDHYAVQRAQYHHYEGFYSDELPLRQALFYPPFSRIINLQISCLQRDQGRRDVERVGRLARQLSETVSLKGKIDIVGPAEAPFPKIKGRYRWQILLKGTNPWSLKTLALEIIAKTADLKLEIKADVDPASFM